LNGILGFTGLLETHFAAHASGDEMTYFNRINKSGKRLMRTVEMIMNFSRLRLGDFRIHPRLINTKQFIGNIVDEFTQTNEKVNINIVFESHCQNPEVITDEYALSNILTELIDNAIKFTVSGRVKVVLYNNQTDHLCVDVKDTGIGMSEEYLKHIFEPYLQEEVGFTRNYEGIGLGLSIVKKLADNIGAVIKVKSTKGLGSVFTIEFKNHGIMPKAELAAISDLTPGNVTKQSVTNTKPVILVVEDDETSQLFIHMVLKKDYSILPAVSATEAIEILKQYKVDLVLMDISLKGLMNGFELTKWIRERKEFVNLSVIAVTAHAFEADRINAEEAGCNFYITKPFKPATLLNAISQVFRKNPVI
jgi:CheY-like chemotaxis protein